MEAGSFLGFLVASFVTTTLPTGAPAVVTSPSICGSNFTCAALNCSFADGDFCGYFQSQDDDFDWTVGKGPTPSLETGPAGDHTTGTGNYIYIETSIPRKQGDKAILVSAMMAPTGGDVCLKFWYYMYGATVETLNVFLVTDSNNYTQMWTRRADQGNMWRQGHARFNSNVNWEIAFEGVAGSDFTGDIALDDISVSMGACPQVLCDFEMDLCGYTYPETDRLRWVRWVYLTSLNRTGPLTDQTTKNGYGHYMLLDGTVAESGDMSSLISPVKEVINSVPHCLYFYYHMGGTDAGRIDVYASSVVYGDKLIWSSNQSYSYWAHGTATIDGSFGDFRVIFKGTVLQGFRGSMALDDIRISDGTCPHIGSCDFEYDLCGYFNPTGPDSYDWLRYSGASPSNETGPLVDHTTNTNEGYYMYTDASTQQAWNRAWLYSEYITATTSSCIEFWYYMYGADIGTLRLYLVQVNNVSRVLWQLSGNQGKQWALVQVNIASPINYQLVFDGETGTGINGNIAIDDIVITNGSCINATPTDWTAVTKSTHTSTLPTSTVTATSTTANTGNCNFEVNFCTWSNVNNDNIDWIRHQGQTLSTGTGPLHDHTYGNVSGTYIYIETSSPSVAGNSAVLMSELFQPEDSSVCFHFFYNMFGETIGALRVWLVTYNGSTENLQEINRQIVWELKGNQADLWHEGIVPLHQQLNSYRILIEAVVGTSYTGDIAIDDISLEYLASVPCLTIPTNAEPSIGTSSTSTTSPISQNPGSSTLSSLSCDFETPCQYTQLTSDTLNWIKNSGQTGTSDTGPDFDHTFGTSSGHYIYIESSFPAIQGDNAKLASPVLLTGDYCLSFWYSMNGVDIGTLNVHIIDGSDDTLVWSSIGNHGDAWYRTQISLRINSAQTKIVFEGIVGAGYMGDIALDDISVINDTCTLLPSTSSTSTVTAPGTTANSGTSALSSLSCDFETPCQYTDLTSDTLEWTRNSGSTSSSGTGPIVDHTTGKISGHYIYLDASSTAKQGDNAKLASPALSYGTGDYCLNFWFYMSGEDVGVLSVHIVDSISDTIIWLISGDHGHAWHQAEVPIQVFSLESKIVFDGIVGRGYPSDIALDDISVIHAKCATPESLVK